MLIAEAQVWTLAMQSQAADDEGIATPVAECEKCGNAFRAVVGGGSQAGFGDETIYWTDFSCGHQFMEAV